MMTMELLIELLKLMSVGLIAGLFSSWLANRDHRQRKWWELRVLAYQKAIESLSDLVYYYDKHYNAIIEYSTLSEDFKSKLDSHWDNAHPTIRKLADSGAFLFSNQANAALKEFMDNRYTDDYVADLEDRLFKAKNCLDKLVICSKKDLKLKSSLIDKVF